MYLLRAIDIKKFYGDRAIFDIERLEISPGDKIGLVGQNGAGKSTLLSILAGVMEPDEGYVDLRGTAAFIAQHQDAEVLASEESGTYGKRSFARPMLSVRPSGGELTRAAISDAFASRPDLLLADEPTTNLDLEGVERLQRELLAFRGALVMVSHDRALLDAVCGEIWEIDSGSLRSFPGNYTAWVAQRTRERESAEREYDDYRREKKRLEATARKVKEKARVATKVPRGVSASDARLISSKNKGSNAEATFSAKAKSIASRIDRMDAKERPGDLPEIAMSLGNASRIMSPFAFRVSDLRVAFGERVLLCDASFDITANKKTVLMGSNGSGKTTLIDILASPGERREVKSAPGLKIGRFGQGHDELDLDMTALQNARSISDMPEHEVRTILARLEIKGDDVHKMCRVMSGGERAKVSFARLFASNLNMLVMDEPTNHIDLYTAEALENLLASWRGTLLLVTHDRRLASNVADRLLFIEDKNIRTFEGTWSEYEARSRTS